MNRVRVSGGREKAGDPIPGSKFFREFCIYCGEPIRVPAESVGMTVKCHLCDHPRPAPHTGITPRQRHALSKTDGG
jgi:hypothetical protein